MLSFTGYGPLMDEYTITIIGMSWNKYLSLVFFLTFQVSMTNESKICKIIKV